MARRVKFRKSSLRFLIKTYNLTSRIKIAYIIKKFPNNLLAGLFGFEKAEYFISDESIKEVPPVEF